ncbi:putative exopolyphosphatase [Aspergillus chevalieri]|uniref:Exopolyphosphatase n=1 Tax=Aspergillus chevalieri TaxID=182096 RepID=A0A7R7VRI9_ASPCH|nr:exopolyphosphatase [Aspergillus chevalieri]BCR89502.1 exopolyphosphatase [Aspergillus chevalieri]
MASKIPSRSLLTFLKEARRAHLQFISSGSPSPIYVVGNPSVDLDSIISAIVYSYFAHNRAHITPIRPHVPLINLSNVAAGSELRRLRPEFVKALWLCTGKSENEKWEDTPESAGDMLREHIVTVQDFATHLRERNIQEQSADAVMVDWNAMPVRDGQRGRGSLDGLSSVVFQVVGCIDHHVDEDFLPSVGSLPSGQPLVVEQSGSCTSLVVNTLRKTGLWHESDKGDTGEAQVAQLALASILIDTANLTSKDKVTNHDTDAFAFLSLKIHNETNTAHTVTTPYYEQIHKTKQNSLDFLAVDEILIRDYKQWEEKSRGESVRLGFCSTVRSLPWIIRKASDSQRLLDSLRALCDKEGLDIVVVMTAFTSPARDNQFCRELLVYAAEGDKKNEVVKETLNSFVSTANSQLGLTDWFPLEDGVSDALSQDIKSTLNQDESWRRVWVQTNLSMSRKQVAPLLREAVATQ